MKPVRAIRIDAENRRIEELVVSSLEDAQKAVGGYIELLAEVGGSNDLYGDEEARLKDLTYAFRYSGTAHPYIVGNGLITGADHETGEWTDTTLTVADVTKSVTFLGALHSELSVRITVEPR